ncbi:MAG TPA: amidohydrolase family protein, partial [Bacillota bacterium]|nr:amidohydrolase family protein [Bacillota bacterium]
GKTREDLLLKRNTGVKIALGENPKRAIGSKGVIPSTRMGSAAVLREALFKGQEYMAKKAAAFAEGKDFTINTQLEPLIPLLKREVPGKIHAHRSDDMMTAMRIADEFDIIITLEHTTSGHLLANEIAKRHIMCTLGPTLGSRGKQEVHAKEYHTAAVLEKAGILFSFTTDASVMAIELLRLSGSLAWKEGCSEETTLKALTIHGAKISGVDDRVGSLAVGKDADFAVYNGHPLSIRSSCMQTWVNGEKAWDKATWKEPWQRGF